MMVEEALYSVLQPVFGDELYPVRHPDPDGLMTGVADVYAIYNRIGGVSIDNMDGDTGLSRIRIQISIFSVDFGQMKAKETAVNSAMNAANTLANSILSDAKYSTAGSLVNLSVGTPGDDYDQDAKRFFNVMEFYCWEKI